MQDYFKNLDIFKPKKNDNSIEITIPIAMDINNNLPKLTVTQIDGGYIICDDGKTFSRLNFSADYYFNLFTQKNSSHSYQIKLDGNKLTKQYPDNFNIQVAVNEFVRFFACLDDFILDENLI